MNLQILEIGQKKLMENCKDRKNQLAFSNYMTWQWIKERAKTDPEARVLVYLANEIGDEPCLTSGFHKIREWLDNLGVPNSYIEILIHMKTIFFNTKIDKFQRNSI